MADAKISQLTASATPLAGTEVLPIVQSSTTKKVSVANLTAGRAVSALSFEATAGNISVTGPGNILQVLNGASVQIQNSPVTANWNLATSGSGLSINSPQNGTLGIANNTAITGTLNITDNLIIGTAGKGIDFSADGQAAGMTSELLDDYEEGLYTPTFTPSTSGTIGLNTSNTRDKVMYTKVGRVVNLIAGIQFLGSSSPVGTSVTMTLPFAAFNGTGTTGSSATVFMYNGVAYNGQINNNATTMTWTINASTIADGSFLYFSITYVAA
jgi:hypothetical protein